MLNIFRRIETNIKHKVRTQRVKCLQYHLIPTNYISFLYYEEKISFIL